jgi:hypothetical protein
VVVLILVTKGSGTPTASPSTDASQVKDFPSSPAGGSSAPSTPSTFTSGQASLVADLPSSYSVTDCTGQPVPSNYTATDALACGKSSATPGPTGAVFFLYADLASLRADFTKLMAAQAVSQTTAQCPTIGFRGYHYDDAPTVTVGNMASYIETDTSAGNGSAVIAWTIEPEKVLAIAVNSGGKNTLPDMCSWWTNN